jgi:acetate kinase
MRREVLVVNCESSSLKLARVAPELNAAHGKTSDGRITRPDSGLLALVVPTNEELMIAQETLHASCEGKP